MTHQPEPKIAIAGGTGLIGKQIRNHLSAQALSPSTGVDAYTGERLAAALNGVEVLIDVLNSPSIAPGVVQDFFTRTTTHLTAAAKAAGVRHYLVLSIVGVDRMASSDYMQAKLEQERILRQSGLPYTIVRATQFFEFLAGIAAAYTNAQGSVVLPEGAFQPIASADVAATLAQLALSTPTNQTLDLAGPDRTTLAAAITTVLNHRNDPRPITTDPAVSYFGASCGSGELVPQGDAILAPTHLEAWLMLS